MVPQGKPSQRETKRLALTFDGSIEEKDTKEQTGTQKEGLSPGWDRRLPFQEYKGLFVRLNTMRSAESPDQRFRQLALLQ